MLLYFKVKNSRSFEDEAELSMIASEADKNATNSIYNEKYNINILKTALIYGANASGKSNLLKAFYDAVHIILNSFKYTKNRKKQLRYFPNKTNYKNINQPTFYIFGFLIDNIQYEYSFSNTAEHIESERLIKFSLNEKEEEIIHFERNFNLEKQLFKAFHDKRIDTPPPSDITEENLFLFLENKITTQNAHNVAPFLKKENLFLSVAAQLADNELYKIPLIDKIWNFFDSNIGISLFTPTLNDTHSFLNVILEDNNKKNTLLNFLQKADFTIKDINSEVTIDEKGKRGFKIYSYHYIINKNEKKELIKYDFFEDESLGTIQFISLLGFLSDDVQNNKILIIDELGNRMHTHLTEYLLEIFQEKNYQLIFTTHDVKLMNSNQISNDQKWIVDRSEIGNSKLYSLSDFDIDKDKMIDNVYLDGLFGGIPNIKR